MSNKTICDGCGAECVNWALFLTGHVRHLADKGKIVGADDIQGIDLCHDCGDPIIAKLGLVVMPGERYGEISESPLPLAPGVAVPVYVPLDEVPARRHQPLP